MLRKPAFAHKTRDAGKFVNSEIIIMRVSVLKLTIAKTALIGLFASFPFTAAYAQSSDSNSALMARQQTRLNTIEENLKTVRGTLETEFRAIRMKIEEMATANDDLSTQTGVKLKELKGQIGELGDTLDIFNQRLRRSIELSSDIEFRVLRLEKRMQTLLTMSSDNLADAILQDDVSGAGTAPSVSMSRDNDTGGSVWTVEKDEALETELAKSEPLDNSTDNASTVEIAAAPSQEAEAQADDSSEASASDDNQTQLADTSAPADTPEQQPEEVVEQAPETVLPEGSPEEQYRFAFGRMLQNDLETAEKGFAEFRQLHPEDERSADVLYWLGRVQFIQGDYGNSAMSFTEFNSEFPDDSRLPEAILMIAESVLNFATSEQACQIFADLPQMLDQPTEAFINRLSELKIAASCDG